MIVYSNTHPRINSIK